VLAYVVYISEHLSHSLHILQLEYRMFFLCLLISHFIHIGFTVDDLGLLIAMVGVIILIMGVIFRVAVGLFVYGFLVL